MAVAAAGALLPFRDLYTSVRQFGAAGKTKIVVTLATYSKPTILKVLKAQLTPVYDSWPGWVDGDPMKAVKDILQTYLINSWLEFWESAEKERMTQESLDKENEGGAGDGITQAKDPTEAPGATPPDASKASDPKRDENVAGGGGGDPTTIKLLSQLVEQLGHVSTRLKSLEAAQGPIELDGAGFPPPPPALLGLFNGDPVGGVGAGPSGAGSGVSTQLLVAPGGTSSHKKALLIIDHLPRPLYETNVNEDALKWEDGVITIGSKDKKAKFSVPGYYTAAQIILEKLVGEVSPEHKYVFESTYGIYTRKIGTLFDTFEQDSVLALDNFVRTETHAGRLKFASNISEPMATLLQRKGGDRGVRPKTESAPKSGSKPSAKRASSGPCRFFNKASGCNRDTCTYSHECNICHRSTHGASSCRDAPKGGAGPKRNKTE